MPNPRTRHSKSRTRKRRTHDKVAIPQLATDPTTKETHLYHHAHWVDGNMYYKGQLVIKAKEEETEEA